MNRDTENISFSLYISSSITITNTCVCVVPGTIFNLWTFSGALVAPQFPEGSAVTSCKT